MTITGLTLAFSFTEVATSTSPLLSVCWITEKLVFDLSWAVQKIAVRRINAVKNGFVMVHGLFNDGSNSKCNFIRMKSLKW